MKKSPAFKFNTTNIIQTIVFCIVSFAVFLVSNETAVAPILRDMFGTKGATIALMIASFVAHQFFTSQGVEFEESKKGVKIDVVNNKEEEFK